jgi:hypothetical protein
MRRDNTKAEDRAMTSGVTHRIALVTTGTGSYTAVPITPQWATEQIEHS